MRRNRLSVRLLLPTAVALLIIPILSCVVFRQGAQAYTRGATQTQLEEFQSRVVPLIQESFPKGHEDEYGERMRAFLEEIKRLIHRAKRKTSLLILSYDLQTVYPREEEELEAAGGFADAFVQGFDRDGLRAQAQSLTLAVGAEEYMANVYEMPGDRSRIKYLVAYAPLSPIEEWVNGATKIVLLISSALSFAVVAVLLLSTRSVTRPLHKLSAEAERIGGGDFSPIEQTFSLDELEALRETMNEMCRRLKATDEAQRRFFQNVSHELRNPLTAIGGLAQGIEQGVYEDCKAPAQAILEESERLGALVGSLLTLSRIENDQEERTLTRIPLLDVAENCADRVRVTARKRGVRLDVLGDDAACAMADEELVFQALENLLTNAVRYAKSAATVRCFEDEDAARIVVEDDGEGISPEDMPHIFERCYKGKGGQFGIGLSIAQSAAEKMKGRLTAQNMPQGGARFTLELKKGA